MKKFLMDLPAFLRLWTARAYMLVFQRAFPLLCNLKGHLELLSILAMPGVDELMKRHGRMRYKYLRKNYLLPSLSITDSLNILKYHYGAVARQLRPDFYTRIFDTPLPLWSLDVEEQNFQICISFPRDLKRSDLMQDHEGDLSLIFKVDGMPVYVMCMTMVPGDLAKKHWHIEHCNKAMFVGRVQGVRDKFNILRSATKTLHDITPARLLLCAVEAISGTLGADFVVGVSTGDQLSNQPHSEGREFFNYDAFWTGIGAHLTAAGLFYIDAGFPERPIESVQQKHRSRTLAKRRFRKTVADAVAERFARELLAPQKNVSAVEPAMAMQRFSATLAPK